MTKTALCTEQGQVERHLSAIGAKVAAASESSEKARAWIGCVEALLIDTQQEIENLYLSLELQKK